jgi:hypothetical protein
VQGRLDDAFVYPGVGSVHPHVFRSRLGGERSIVEYQVRQMARGAAIAITCRGEVELSPLHHGLVDDLVRVGLRDPEITIHRVDRLGRQATGKLKRFVPLDA